MWPWSKIRALEQATREHLKAVAGYEGQVRVFEGTVRFERERYDALLAATLDLKREGFEPPRPLPDAPVAADDLPPAVRKAILSRARPGSDLFAQLATWARNEMAATDGSVDAAVVVAAAVEQGQDPADYGV